MSTSRKRFTLGELADVHENFAYSDRPSKKAELHGRSRRRGSIR